MSELGVNKVVLVGRSGGDAVLRYTAGGKPVANFSLAVNESFRSRDGEKKDHLEWFPCVCWNKLGEIAGQYVTKGKLVFVEGRLQTRRYDDREGNAQSDRGRRNPIAPAERERQWQWEREFRVEGSGRRSVASGQYHGPGTGKSVGR